MKPNPTKKAHALMGSLWLLSTALPIAAQTTTSGSISYEAMQRVDHSKTKIIINGQEVKPGSPDAPPDMPDVRTFSLQLVFSGNHAKEVNEGTGPVMRRIEGSPGGGMRDQPVKMEPPFSERKYLDLAAQQQVQVLEVRKDGAVKTYRADEPLNKASDWKETGQTRKIAGYSCRKATSPWKGETYTLWYTTELPFTYSPIKGLTPEKGVVLQVEGNDESFKAVKVEAKAVAENDVTPPAEAEKVTTEQLNKIREKAMATFHQRMMSSPDR